MSDETEKFKVGDRVRSVRVGERAAFVGTVERQFTFNTWHVRDDEERLWHRSSNELSPDTEKEPT